MLDNIKSFLGIKLERVERLRQESVARNTDNADRAWPAPEMRQLADLFKGQLVNLVNAKHFYKSVTWKYQLAAPLMCSLRKAAFSPGSWKTHEKTHRTNPRFDSQPREPPPTALTGQESEEEDKKRSKVKRNSCRMLLYREIRGSQWNFRYQNFHTQNQDIDLGLGARDDITSISTGCWVKSLWTTYQGESKVSKVGEAQEITESPSKVSHVRL